MSLGFVDVEVSELSRFVDGMDWPGAAEACDATLLLVCDGKVAGKLVLLFSLTEGFGFARFRGLMV